MQNFSIQLHSFVDLITNSSTTIYVNHDDCEKPLREMVNEMIQVLLPDANLTIDDMFWIKVIPNYDYNIDDYYPDECYDINEELLPYEERAKILLALEDQVVMSATPVPQWMISASNYESRIVLKPKNRKYKILADKIVRFLNSSDCEANYG